MYQSLKLYQILCDLQEHIAFAFTVKLNLHPAKHDNFLSYMVTCSENEPHIRKLGLNQNYNHPIDLKPVSSQSQSRCLYLVPQISSCTGALTQLAFNGIHKPI